jgi:hypothetical protein
MRSSKVKKKSSFPAKTIGIGLGSVLGVAAILWVPVLRPAYRQHRASHDVSQLHEAIQGFIKLEGEYPAGDFATVCRLLRGEMVGTQNSRKLDYVEAYDANAKGEFLDPWGKPYRLVLDRNVRVYSCGPNQIDDQGAGDDIVAK